MVARVLYVVLGSSESESALLTGMFTHTRNLFS